jgi:diguanylate cyclase (GGDEF)-like protein
MLNRVMVGFALLVSCLLLYAAHRATDSYNDMRSATENYIARQQSAVDMKAGSDYLTEQVRCFAMTGDTDYLWSYFEEVDVTHRRDNALAALKDAALGDEPYAALEIAMAHSVELMDREYYSMRLTIEAFGYDLADFPEVIRQVRLSPADAALSAAQKADLARTMVFDEVYQAQKSAINQNLQICLDALIQVTERQQALASGNMLALLREQQILIFVLLVIVLLIVLMTSLLVIHPLRKGITQIRAKQPISLEGSNEFQFLAAAYNLMFEANQKRTEKLTYEATHDKLTGLYNRSGYDALCQELDLDSCALLMIDVDHFKEVNDTYGHDMGDRVLSSVAATLRDHFRSEDHVCRIGGDEFAVIMRNAQPELSDLIRRKIQSVNKRLFSPEDDLPPVSLSVGVAFGCQMDDNIGDIFKAADAALYQVKNRGRNGIEFHVPQN